MDPVDLQIVASGLSYYVDGMGQVIYDKPAWWLVIGFSLGISIGFILIFRRIRVCSFCRTMHPRRPAGMTAVEYERFYCHGVWNKKMSKKPDWEGRIGD